VRWRILWQRDSRVIGSYLILIGFVFLFVLCVNYLQRLEQRYLIPLQLFQSMIFDSCGLQLLESRHLAQDNVSGQRFQRQLLSRTRPLRVLLRPS
jgi:hypothetical protein